MAKTPPKNSPLKAPAPPAKTSSKRQKPAAPIPTPPPAPPKPSGGIVRLGIISEEDERGDVASDGLSDRQIIFCNLYVKFWNATKAARMAGYKDPECSGYENRQKPAIQKYIQSKIAEKCMDRDEVLTRLADVARGAHADFWKFYDATLKEQELEEEILDGQLNGELNARTYQENLGEALRRVTPYLDVQELVKCGYGHLIKKFKVEHGQICEVEFHDMMAALSLIGRHLTLFTDKIEHSGKIETPVTKNELDPYAGLERGELNSRIAETLKNSGSG